MMTRSMFSCHTTPSRTPIILIGSTLCCAVVAVTTFILQQKRQKRRRPFPNIPHVHPTPPHWLLGHLPLLAVKGDVVAGMKQLVVDAAVGAQRVTTFWALQTPVFSTLDASLIRRILKASSLRQNNATTRRHFRKMFGETSVIMLNGKEWKENRDIYLKAFATHHAHDLVKTLWNVGAKVQETVAKTVQRQENGVLSMDAVDLCRMATLDAFGMAALGHDFGCCNGENLCKSPVFHQIGFMQQELTRRCYQHRMWWPAQVYWLPTRANRDLARENGALRQTLLAAIQQRRRDLKDETITEKKDLLSGLLRTNVSRGEKGLTDEFLSDWLITAIFGGYDTSSLALAYTLFCLAKYPTYQSEVVKEINRVVDRGIQAEEPLSNDLLKVFAEPSDHLPLLFACFWETLRMYSPTTNVARTLSKDLQFELDGETTTLPKGARCLISIYCAMRSDHNFSAPDTFFPERWAQKTSDGTWEKRTETNDRKLVIERGDPGAYFAFSSGARNCVGQPLAVRMVPLLLTIFLQRFEIDLESPDLELCFDRYGANQVPVGGIPVKIKERGRQAFEG